MTKPLFAPPKVYTLPLSKGSDLIVNFKRKVDGVYTDYPPGVRVFLEIDRSKSAPLRSEAAITGYHAVCRFESEVVDLVGASLWRCIVQYPDTPNPTERVPVNGMTKRYDGREQP